MDNNVSHYHKYLHLGFSAVSIMTDGVSRVFSWWWIILFPIITNAGVCSMHDRCENVSVISREWYVGDGLWHAIPTLCRQVFICVHLVLQWGLIIYTAAWSPWACEKFCSVYFVRFTMVIATQDSVCLWQRKLWCVTIGIEMISEWPWWDIKFDLCHFTTILYYIC